MNTSAHSAVYRKDIDGLRAIAVLAVIFFHMGFLPNGYLGVDVFFVISGFLITGIIYRDTIEDRFSISDFYLRRTRRILPLVSFICAVTLPIGMATMLPDDLENLAQSVIATNLFSNNILQAITTRNYWDVVNEYKPLMHTWSLGVEEQYYLLYPLLFVVLGKSRASWAVRILSILAGISLAAYLMQHVQHKRFYYLPYRFYEIASGGVIAIVLEGRLLQHSLATLPLLGLVLLLTTQLPMISSDATLILTVVTTACLLATSRGGNSLGGWLLENPISILIGKISFSLYMWHQVVLAFARYGAFGELTPFRLALIFASTVALSLCTYYLVERPFRNSRTIKTGYLLLTICVFFVGTNTVSLWIYLNAGVLHDVPELDISRDGAQKGLHAQYNDNIRAYDRQFSDPMRMHVLVIGNSFARDWANVLLESRHRDDIEISYVEAPLTHPKLIERAEGADVIFVSEARRHDIDSLGLQEQKVWSIGTKNFGNNNGYAYNHRSDSYCGQRTKIQQRYYERNRELRREYPTRFVDMVQAVIDDDYNVPVFTPECRFISQDCLHFTKAGAQYFARILDAKIGEILYGAKGRDSAARENAE